MTSTVQHPPLLVARVVHLVLEEALAARALIPQQ
jgi:hypothetical protein